MASSILSFNFHILMHASYIIAQELPDRKSRLAGTSIAYFLARDAAVKTIDARRTTFQSGGEVDGIREIQQLGDGQAYGVVYWDNVDNRGLGWWVHSNIRGHKESSTDVLGFVDNLTAVDKATNIPGIK
jgi:hypothetical protein